MKGNDNSFSAMAALTLLLGFNILAIVNVTGLMEKYTYEQLKVPIILGGISLFVINYLIFLKDKKYLEIEKIFINESKRKKQIGNIIIILYAI